MSEQADITNTFVNEVKTTQTFFALQEKESENYVVLDSINFENTEVMPLWSSFALAKNHCIDEWQHYQPAEITLAEWMEFWIEDLNQDNIIIGVNWPEDGSCVEVDLAEFTQLLSTIETYK